MLINGIRKLPMPNPAIEAVKPVRNQQLQQKAQT
jgi:hypothetical protein